MDWSERKLRLDWCWSSQVVIEGVRNTEFDCWLSPVPSPRPSLENFNFVTNRIEQLTICTGGNRRNWRPWNILLSNWEENLDLKIFTNFADGLKALNRISFKVKGKLDLRTTVLISGRQRKVWQLNSWEGNYIGIFG